MCVHCVCVCVHVYMCACMHACVCVCVVCVSLYTVHCVDDCASDSLPVVVLLPPQEDITQRPQNQVSWNTLVLGPDLDQHTHTHTRTHARTHTHHGMW